MANICRYTHLDKSSLGPSIVFQSVKRAFRPGIWGHRASLVFSALVLVLLRVPCALDWEGSCRSARASPEAAAGPPGARGLAGSRGTALPARALVPWGPSPARSPVSALLHLVAALTWLFKKCLWVLFWFLCLVALLCGIPGNS